MLLSEVEPGVSSYIRMERYVNQGSPSGFTDKYSTSASTRPYGKRKSFWLPMYEIDTTKNELTSVGGRSPADGALTGFPIHPDMQQVFEAQISARQCGRLKVMPTSSARTVLTDPTAHGRFFIKLAYLGLVGRIERPIDHARALSSVEVSLRLEKEIAAGNLPGTSIYREVFGESITVGATSKGAWGYVLREAKPFPHPAFEPVVVPAFALFSSDRGRPDDPTILEQILRCSLQRPEEYLLEQLIFPVLDSYFRVLLTTGLQLEAHSQNILYLFDSFGRTSSIVVRDMESIDKDLNLMKTLRLPDVFESRDYKCLRAEDYNYQIMHSFMYDFKLGEYLITPLIDEYVRVYPRGNVSQIKSRIREHVAAYLERLPADFFPKGEWYSYASIVHDQGKRRPYTSRPHPSYR